MGKMTQTTEELVAEMRAKWMRYGNRLGEVEGDGSPVGASFIIAACSGVHDVLILCQVISDLIEELSVR